MPPSPEHHAGNQGSGRPYADNTPQGANVNLFIQISLGHANVETTLNIYTHVVPDTHRKAIEDLERVLFPSVPKLADSGERDGLVIQ